MKRTSGKTICKFSFALFLLAPFVFCHPARAEDPVPIFSESFESLESIQTDGGTQNGITLESGKSGNGVLINGSDTLSFPTTDNLDFQKGTVEFWVKPSWNGDSPDKTYYFFNTGDTDHSQTGFYINKATVWNGWSRIFGWFFGSGGSGRADTLQTEYTNPAVMGWKSGEWHKVRFFWDFTLADSDKYVALEVDDKFILPVTKFNPSFGTLPDKFYVGSSASGSSQANAVIDELKIYDQSLLPFGPSTTRFPFDPEDSQTETNLRNIFMGDGICSSFETYNDDSSGCSKLSDSVKPGENVLFYQKSPFEGVYENTIPKESDIDTELNYQAAGNESETLFFNVYSRQNLNNVRVSYTDFSGSAGTISKSHLDLRVVKNWFQFGVMPRYVPELLLYNDQIPLESQSWNYDTNVLPSLPSLDHVETKITANTSKQFAVVAEVPQDAEPGVYTSTVTLEADGISDQEVEIKLEVLPFELRETEKRYGIYKGTPNCSLFPNAQSCKLSVFQKEVEDIEKHGLNALEATFNIPADKISAVGNAGLEDLVVDLRNYGGADVVPLSGTVLNETLSAMQAAGLGAYYYISDEANTDAIIGKHIPRSIQVHEAGGKAMAAIYKQQADKLDDAGNSIYNSFPEGTFEPVDWANYGKTSDALQYFDDVRTGQATKNTNKIETYYWQTDGSENPALNRFFAGFYFFNSHMDGVVPLAYDYYATQNPFNDYWRFIHQGNPYSAKFLAYPSLEGPVPTIEWEAFREGIDDERYLETWKWYKEKVAKVNPSMASESEQAVEDILDHYIYSDGKFLLNGTPRDMTIDLACNHIPTKQFSEDRKAVISEIKKLKNYSDEHLFSADINQDSLVNALDLDILKTDFLKLIAGLANSRSDIDGDGQATIKDVGILMSEWR